MNGEPFASVNVTRKLLNILWAFKVLHSMGPDYFNGGFNPVIIGKRLSDLKQMKEIRNLRKI